MFKTQQVTVALVATLMFFHLLQAQAHGHQPRGLGNATGADAILGYWQRSEGEAVVEMRRRTDGYYGVIVASELHPEVVGTEIFKSLQYDAKDRLWRGRVYSMERRRDFKIEMALPHPDHFVIKLRVLFFSRSVQFNRQQRL